MHKLKKTIPKKKKKKHSNYSDPEKLVRDLRREVKKQEKLLSKFLLVNGGIRIGY